MGMKQLYLVDCDGPGCEQMLAIRGTNSQPFHYLNDEKWLSYIDPDDDHKTKCYCPSCKGKVEKDRGLIQDGN